MTEAQEKPVQAARRWPVGWYVFVAVALLAVCVVPEWFPVTPSVSDSYVFGFNNRVALVLLLALMAGGTLWTRGWGMFLAAPTAQRADALKRRDLMWAMVFTVAFAGVLLALVHPFAGVNESTYLVDRARMAAEGLRPYRDFEFSYGALLVYGPVGVARVLGVSIATGYWIFWLANCVLSTLLLYAVVNAVEYGSPDRRRIFWFFAVVSVLGFFSTGTNYTFVRFATGAWFAVTMARVLRRRGWMAAAAVAYAGMLATLLISPEMGLAYFAGALLWLVLERGPWRPVRAGSLAALCLAAGATFAVAAHFQYFELMRVMSAGGSNEPYMPAPHMVVLFVTTAACAAWVRFRWRAGTIEDTLSALVVVSAAALPSALGRCDSGHVFWGAFGILLAGWMLLSRTRLRHVATAAFVVTFLLAPQLTASSGLKAFARAAGQRIFAGNGTGSGARMAEWVARHALGRERAERRLQVLRAAAARPEKIDFARVYPGVAAGQTFAAPLDYEPDTLSEYPSPQIFQGRYFGLQNVLTPAQMQAKVDELAAHPERDLLLPSGFPDMCAEDPTGNVHWIRRLFPYWRRPRHTENLDAPLCGYILRQYRQASPAGPEDYGYGLWFRR